MKRKILCVIFCMLLIGASICTIFAADLSANEGTSVGTATIASMERITSPVNFGFEIVSIGRDGVVADFVSQSRVTTSPYIGIKGTSTEAEKNSEYQYVFEYDKEYSFVYTVIENGVETVYNSFLSVENGENTRVVFGEIIKNVISDEPTRAVGLIYESESNNTQSTADITYDDYDNRGTITSSIDVDWWKVSFTQSGRANFWLGEIGPGGNYDISLYNALGWQIGRSANIGQTAELIQYDVLPNTYYYVKIESVLGTSPVFYLFRAKNYPETQGENSIQDGKVYHIQNVGNNQYMTVGKACNASSLSYAYIYTSSASSDDGQNNGQRMRLNYDTTGFYTVAPLCSFNGQYRVLDVYGGLSSAAKQLWLYPDNGASEEHFVFELQSDNSYIISFKDNPSYVLDVNSSNYNKVFANTRTGLDSQKWIVTADTTYNAKEDLYNTYNWQWPLASSFYLTSSYGRRTLDSGSTYEFHSAVDISANNGTNVLCPTSATYAHSGRDAKYGCGYFLIIETEDAVYQNSNQKLRLLFQHLMQDATVTYSDITEVETIAQGTLIARTGDSGTPGSYHLHYGVINDGSDVFINGGNNYDTRTFTNTEQPLMFYPNVNFTYN